MKNVCEQAALYFYGELDEKQAAQFRAHLENCPACKRELEFIKQTQAALVPPAAPADLVEKVLRKAKPLPWWQRVYKPAFVAVLMCGLGLGVFFGLQHHASVETDNDWIVYVSPDTDEEYNNFVLDFEEFEADF